MRHKNPSAFQSTDFYLYFCVTAEIFKGGVENVISAFFVEVRVESVHCLEELIGEH